MAIIHLHNLKCCARLGITESERENPQPICFDVWLHTSFAKAMTDDIACTINYSEVAGQVQQFVAVGKWNLLEKLIVELANNLRQRFGCHIEIELRKFVVSKTDYVSVRYSTHEAA